MSWARFDDRAPHHRKVKRLSDAAFRLWFTSICHCAEYLTDGRIDAKDVPELPKAPTGRALQAAIGELVEAGCWDVIEGGWEVHDYLDWNPTGDEARAKREARAEAGRKGGQNSGKARSKKEAIASTPKKQTESAEEPKTNPVPVPVLVPSPKAAEALPELPALSAQNPAAAVRPRNLEQALTLDIRARAEFAEREKHLAEHTEPNRWPEVIAFAEAAHEAMGLTAPSLGTFGRDKGVGAIVALFAVFTPTELATALGAVPNDPWFKSRRGLSSFTPEVVRRLLDSRPNASGVTCTSKRQPDYPGQKSFRATDLEEKTA